MRRLPDVRKHMRSAGCLLCSHARLLYPSTTTDEKILYDPDTGFLFQTSRFFAFTLLELCCLFSPFLFCSSRSGLRRLVVQITHWNFAVRLPTGLALINSIDVFPVSRNIGQIDVILSKLRTSRMSFTRDSMRRPVHSLTKLDDALCTPNLASLRIDVARSRRQAQRVHGHA